MPEGITIDLTPIVLAIIGVLGTIITANVIPWLKEKKLMGWIKIAVNAAEQMAKEGIIKPEEKLQHATKYLESKGVKVDTDEIMNAIKSAVYEVNVSSAVIKSSNTVVTPSTNLTLKADTLTVSNPSKLAIKEVLDNASVKNSGVIIQTDQNSIDSANQTV